MYVPGTPMGSIHDTLDNSPPPVMWGQFEFDLTKAQTVRFEKLFAKAMNADNFVMGTIDIRRQALTVAFRCLMLVNSVQAARWVIECPLNTLVGIDKPSPPSVLICAGLLNHC